MASQQNARLAASAAVTLWRYALESGGLQAQSLLLLPAAGVPDHGHAYTLRHLAAALEALVAVLPGGHSRVHAHNPDHQASPASPPSASQAPFAPSADDDDATGADSNLDALVHVNRLVQVARYQLQNEYDLPSVAACLMAISRLPAVLRPSDIAAPFFERLSAPAYLFNLDKEPPRAMVSVLHAMGKLKMWKALGGGRAGSLIITKVRNAVVRALANRMPELTADDAATAVQAMARMSLPANYHFTQRLTQHVTQTLAPQSAVDAPQAARLVWALGATMALRRQRLATYVAPPAGSEAGGRHHHRHRPDDTGGAADNVEGDGTPAAGRGAAPTVHSADDQEQLERGVRAMSVVLAGVTSRSLPSLAPVQLVQLVLGFARLGAPVADEAGDFYAQLTVQLLQHVQGHRLNISSLADVVHCYQALGLDEPGLRAAVAQQVTDAAQRSPGGQLYWRDVVLLAQAYRRADQPELWALLQEHIRQRVDRERPDLGVLLATLEKEGADDDVVGLVRAAAEDAAQRALLNSSSLWRSAAGSSS